MKMKAWIPGIVAMMAFVTVQASAHVAASCASPSSRFSEFAANRVDSGSDDDFAWFDESAFDECGCHAEPTKTWQVTASALFLHRRDPAAADLVVDAIDGARILNARDFDLGVHTGFDVSLSRQIGDRCAIEGRYFGVDHWNAGITAATEPGRLLQWNTAPPVFVWAGTGIAATHTSELHNVEINGRYRWNDRWALLAGFRYVELDEQFTAELIGADVPFSYRAAARNRLYGGQLGANVVLWDCGGRFTADAVGKAGIFGNAASQHGSYATDIVTFSTTGDRSPVSLVGELGITGNYRISQRWSATLGYQLLWINQVVLATEQLASTDFVFGSGVAATGDTFYHGASIGLKYVR